MGFVSALKNKFLSATLAASMMFGAANANAADPPKTGEGANASPAAASVNPKPAKKISNTYEILPNSNFKTEIERAEKFFLENEGIGIVVCIPTKMMSDPENKADIETIGQKLSARLQRDEIPSLAIIVPSKYNHDPVSVNFINGQKNEGGYYRAIFVVLSELNKAKMDEIVEQFRIATYKYTSLPSSAALAAKPAPIN